MGGSFRYFLCGSCGCLQAEDTGIELSPYYPSNYYSFNPPLHSSGFRGWLMKERDRAALGWSTALGNVLHALRPNAPLLALRGLNLQHGDRVADIGCGAGVVLKQLSALGFSDLTGIDPNIENSITISKGLRIVKCRLSDVASQFDLLMFHHSLEHIPDQIGVMREAFERLKPGGYCLVRIPLVSSEAWETYGLNWVQLDAPRHLFLHSEASMLALARRSGFEVASVQYDSDDFQFWGSEALRRGLPLIDKATGRPNLDTQSLARAGRSKWREEARRLNAARRGDQASFVFRRP